MAKKILVVDDSSTVTGLVQMIMEQQGYEVVTASNGRDALKIVRDSPPDLILLDIEMPVMDGYTMLRTLRYRFRDFRRDIPVVCLTSKGKLEDVFYLEGAVDFIEKSEEAYRILPEKVAAAFKKAEENSPE